MPPKTRPRAPDYTDAEIQVIRQNFSRHNTILAAKHSNDTTQKTKNAIYQQITAEVNALGVAERSLQSIKDKWQTLKKTVKEKVSAAVRTKKRDREMTGGGENPSIDDPDILDKLTEHEKQVLEVIPAEQIIGVSGGFATDERGENLTADVDPHATNKTSQKRPSSCPLDLSPTKKLKKPIIDVESSQASIIVKPSTTKCTTSSEYYKEMIKLETEKLELKRVSLKMKKWYMEQKIAILRENQQSSRHHENQEYNGGQESRLTTLVPVQAREFASCSSASQHDWCDGSNLSF